MSASCFRTLGVSESATLSEIQLAYQRRSQMCSPDQYPEGDLRRVIAEDLTKQLDSAFRAARLLVIANAEQAARPVRGEGRLRRLTRCYCSVIRKKRKKRGFFRSFLERLPMALALRSGIL